MGNHQSNQNIEYFTRNNKINHKVHRCKKCRRCPRCPRCKCNSGCTLCKKKIENLKNDITNLQLALYKCQTDY